jgi:hypothetical protein
MPKAQSRGEGGGVRKGGEGEAEKSCLCKWGQKTRIHDQKEKESRESSNKKHTAKGREAREEGGEWERKRMGKKKKVAQKLDFWWIVEIIRKNRVGSDF